MNADVGSPRRCPASVTQREPADLAGQKIDQLDGVGANRLDAVPPRDRFPFLHEERVAAQRRDDRRADGLVARAGPRRCRRARSQARPAAAARPAPARPREPPRRRWRRCARGANVNGLRSKGVGAGAVARRDAEPLGLRLDLRRRAPRSRWFRRAAAGSSGTGGWRTASPPRTPATPATTTRRRCKPPPVWQS